MITLASLFTAAMAVGGAHAHTVERTRRDTGFDIVLDIRNQSLWEQGHFECAHYAPFEVLNAMWPRTEYTDTQLRADSRSRTSDDDLSVFPKEVVDLIKAIRLWTADATSETEYLRAALVFPLAWKGLIKDPTHVDHQYDELRRDSNVWIPRLMVLLKEECGYMFVGTYSYDPSMEGVCKGGTTVVHGAASDENPPGGNVSTTPSTKAGVGIPETMTMAPTTTTADMHHPLTTTRTPAPVGTQNPHPTSHQSTPHQNGNSNTCNGVPDKPSCKPIAAFCKHVSEAQRNGCPVTCDTCPPPKPPMPPHSHAPLTTWYFNPEQNVYRGMGILSQMKTFMAPFNEALCVDSPIVFDVRQSGSTPNMPATGAVCSKIDSAFKLPMPVEGDENALSPSEYTMEVTNALLSMQRQVDDPFIILVFSNDDLVEFGHPSARLAQIRGNIMAQFSFSNVAAMTAVQFNSFCSSGVDCVADDDDEEVLPVYTHGDFLFDLRLEEEISATPIGCAMQANQFEGVSDAQMEADITRIMTAKFDEINGTAHINLNLILSDDPHGQILMPAKGVPSSDLDIRYRLLEAMKAILAIQPHTMTVGNPDKVAEFNRQCTLTKNAATTTPGLEVTTSRAPTSSIATTMQTSATPLPERTPTTGTPPFTPPKTAQDSQDKHKDTHNMPYGDKSSRASTMIVTSTTTTTTSSIQLVVHTKGSTRTTARTTTADKDWGAADTSTTTTTAKGGGPNTAPATTISTTTKAPTTYKPINHDEVQDRKKVSNQTIVLAVSCVVGISFGVLLGQLGRRYQNRYRRHANACLPACCSALCADDDERWRRRQGGGRRIAQYARLPYVDGAGRVPPAEVGHIPMAELSDTCDDTEDDDALLEAGGVEEMQEGGVVDASDLTDGVVEEELHANPDTDLYQAPLLENAF